MRVPAGHTAGSIAASSPPTLYRERNTCSRRPIGGLHCGHTGSPIDPPPGHVLPQCHGGLHCGWNGVHRPGGSGRMFLPSSGGLHCGGSHAWAPASGLCWRSRRSTAGSIAVGPTWARRQPGDPGAPAVQRRAPLRQPAGWTTRSSRCSRLLTAGSIAAGRRSRCRRRRATCSRRSTAGSIAVRTTTRCRQCLYSLLPPSSGGLHCGVHPMTFHTWFVPGAPAVQRRAPLRRDVPDATRPELCQCSRRLTAGSIAAPTATSGRSRR